MHFKKILSSILDIFFNIIKYLLKILLNVFKAIFTFLTGFILAKFFKDKNSNNKTSEYDDDLKTEFEEKFSTYNEDLDDTFSDTVKESHSNNIDDTFNIDETCIYNRKKSYNTNNIESKYIKELNIIKDQISGPMKIKVDDLISVTEQIIIKANKKPNLKEKTYSSLNFYLPTTIKLLDEYITLNNIKNKTNNVKYTINDIECSMDTIISAFYKILDNLYEDSTANIVEEIRNLKQSMSKDGLI
ncbi:hypothetical protein [Peptoniphilus stercorisuis]|uniref:5-bromo-4-chloroindolyl phosphate hydrolysis protein n=1 Tax=Peptoniphilus stercorisuis TaxID=1436965 RepID=A0ABS4KE00_9FIRM|nr:hypothetical protein [Peptoniphilus stercorisuis]MBP2025992.1 hypothetical protein [Peptoniphilus stercorisuis]